MQLSPGSRLGPYEISTRIGAGGMGEVWRAKDTRLDRSVAIKILPEELAHNTQLRLRLEREAKAISQLNHPNICTLYDVGEDYLVMELLEGDTLADRIDRGAMPVADVLKYGAQIAEALDRAHRAGVIHRDLKPGNVMLTKTGAKLLDFGIARSELETRLSPDQTTQVVSQVLTTEGMVIGTFEYMSPEQLEAKPADARTDIFALGCVLYEMATGRRAFQGASRPSLIAAIVAGTPQSVTSITPGAPPLLEHVIAKCLEKDPDQRWQSAHDVAQELQWIAKDLERGVVARRKRQPVHWAVAAALGAIAIAMTALWLRERAKPLPQVAFTIESPSNAQIHQATISPDGNSVAMEYIERGASEYTLAIRRIDDLEPKKIGTTKSAQHTAWSPDGKWLAYFEDGKILRMPTGGGPVETVCGDVSYGMGLAWGADNTIIFSPRIGEGLYRVAATGGRASPLTSLDAKRNESLHGWPKFLPDGKHFLFLVHTVGEKQNEIHAGSLDGKHSRVLDADYLVGYARGSIVFIRDSSMFAQQFDAGGLALKGDPRRIVSGVFYLESSSHAPATVSNDGAILYFPIRPSRVSAAWYDLKGQRIISAFDDQSLVSYQLSRDGEKLLLIKSNDAKGANEIYTLDLARGVRTRVTGGRADHRTARWSPWGERIYFSSDRGGFYEIFKQVEDGTTPAEKVWGENNDIHVLDVSPDGRFLLVSRYTPATRGDLWLYPLTPNGGKPRAIIASDAGESEGAWSRDGKWLAFTSDRSGRSELYVRPFPEGRAVQVSIDGSSGPLWLHDGRLSWAGPDNVLYAATIADNAGAPQPSKPERLFALDQSVITWDASPTDDRFLIASKADALDQITLVNYVRRAW